MAASLVDLEECFSCGNSLPLYEDDVYEAISYDGNAAFFWITINMPTPYQGVLFAAADASSGCLCLSRSTLMRMLPHIRLVLALQTRLLPTNLN
jgi:hypothetical protein